MLGVSVRGGERRGDHQLFTYQVEIPWTPSCGRGGSLGRGTSVILSVAVVRCLDRRTKNNNDDDNTKINYK